jgi:hypothetical protein
LVVERARVYPAQAAQVVLVLEDLVMENLLQRQTQEGLEHQVKEIMADQVMVFRHPEGVVAAVVPALLVQLRL